MQDVKWSGYRAGDNDGFELIRLNFGESIR